MRSRIFLLTIILFYSCVFCSCFKEDDYNKIDSDSVIKFLSGSETVMADGKSTTEIKVQLFIDAASNRNDVVLKTSLGSFVGGAGDSIVVKADVTSKIATAKLSSIRAGDANITAVAQQVKAKDGPVITFTKAFPDNIKISVDSFVIYNRFNSEVLITATLSTGNGGKPSQGHSVSFSVVNASSVPVGMFLNNQNVSMTGADGKATIRYSAGPGVDPGYLTIMGTTLKSDQTPIGATTQIYLSN